MSNSMMTTSVIGSPLPSFPTSKETPKKASIIKSEKPKLVLHVGPRKTATTSIQMGVLYMEQTKRFAGMASPKQDLMDKVFLMNNYKIIYHGWAASERIVLECFHKLDPDPAKDECNYDLWNDLIAKFDEAYDQGRNVLMSEEAFSIVPHTHEVKELFQKLKEKWDVHIIIVHRPLEAWFPSMYAEYRIRGMYNKQNKHWLHYTSEDPKPKEETLPEWFDMVWPKIDDVEADPIGTIKWYEELFGSQAIHLQEMFIPNQPDITVRFVCDALSEISEVPRACEHVKRRAQKTLSRNSAAILPLNEDLVILKVSNKMFGGKTKHAYPEEIKHEWFKRNNLTYEYSERCHNYERHEATLLFRELLSSKNLTFEKDLPSVCLNEEQINMLANRTFYTDKMMSLNPRSYDDIIHSIKNNYKFCNVDAEKVMVMFKDWFKSGNFIEYCGWNNPFATEDSSK